MQLIPPNSEAVVCADEHGAGVAQPGRHGAVVVRDPVLEHERAFGQRPAHDRVELLHAHGHAAEGQGDVRLRRSVAGLLLVDEAHGVQSATP